MSIITLQRANTFIVLISIFSIISCSNDVDSIYQPIIQAEQTLSLASSTSSHEAANEEQAIVVPTSILHTQLFSSINNPKYKHPEQRHITNKYNDIYSKNLVKLTHKNSSNNHVGQHIEVINGNKKVAKFTQAKATNTQYKIGLKYYNGKDIKQDYEKAFECFSKAAKQGHADAQVQLGFMYEQGKGVAQDDHRAFKWFKKAAIQGHAYAQNKLGFMYNNSIGIKRNPKEAIVWYKKAAKKGHPVAQYNLGCMYYNGEVTTQDYKKSFKWMFKAAKRGEMSAKYILGLMYYYGEGARQDYQQAYQLFLEAANGGDMVAQCKLGLMYYTGEGVVQNYPKALKWLKKAAIQEYSDAYYNLGFMYSKGEGVKQHNKKALEFFVKAANQGNIVAKNQLGVIYYTGEIVQQDYQKAIRFFTIAADHGHDVAQYNLGLMYYEGKGVNQDYKKAFQWFSKSANQGNIAAKNQLGLMYYKGDSVQQNYQEAIKFFIKAADQGDNAAQYNLGHMYYTGKGIIQDYKKAFQWFLKSATQGYIYSQYCLGIMYYKGEDIQQDYQQAIYWLTQAAEQGYNAAQNQLGFLLYLNTLNVNSADSLWKELFLDLGACKIWEDLQARKTNLVFNLTKFTNTELAINQANNVIAAALNYIAYREILVKYLIIRGGNTKNKKIDFLPLVISKLTSLQKLSLTNHMLSELSPSMSQLTQLKILKLSRNKFTILPNVIKNLTGLQKLNLANNELQELSACISELIYLKQLNLANNKLKALPSSLLMLYNNNNLSINLTGNPIYKYNPNTLYPFTEHTLRNYVYDKLPHTLLILCANTILKHTGKTQRWMYNEETKAEGMFQKTLNIFSKMYSPEPVLQPKYPILFKEETLQEHLPQELWLDNLYELVKQACNGKDQRKIILFKHAKGQALPFYLSYPLCTPQDVKVMLQQVKDGGLKAYLNIS